MKLYFSDQAGESCHTVDYFYEYMRENNVKELTLFRAKPEFGSEYFFCRECSDVGEVGNSDCGKLCESYKPRNGKNGRCVHSTFVYDVTDEKRILKIKP